MKQVTIVGLGMIGTSLGLALRALPSPPRVIGNDNQYDPTRRASSMKAVDKVEKHLEDAVSGSDLVVVSTPVGAISEVLSRMVGALAEGCVVTDTGSTKRQIVRAAEELLPSSVAFVGGHPMTGRATGGVDQPDASIFHGAVYCLTPSPSTPAPAVARVADMVQRIGARPYFTDPAEHDGLVAGISHVPYLVAATLMATTASQEGWREMSILAAGGFDTSTRLAAHDPKMYADIMASNADNVARHLDVLIRGLGEARSRLLGGGTGLASDLQEAHRLRMEWELQKRREKEEE